MNKIQCGTYRVAETKVFHYAGYECAAWWQDVKVEAGEYPVNALIESGRVKYFVVSLPGTVVDANFQSLWGGNAIGKYDKTRDINIPGSYYIQAYDYCVFQEINETPGTPWNIDLSLLPNLSTCPTCGAAVTLYAGPRECPRCSVASQDVRVAAIKLRFPRILAAAKKYNYRAGEFYRILDSSIDQYFKERASTDPYDYHQREVTSIIAKIRELQHAERAGKTVSA